MEARRRLSIFVNLTNPFVKRLRALKALAINIDGMFNDRAWWMQPILIELLQGAARLGKTVYICTSRFEPMDCLDIDFFTTNNLHHPQHPPHLSACFDFLGVENEYYGFAIYRFIKRRQIEYLSLKDYIVNISPPSLTLSIIYSDPYQSSLLHVGGGQFGYVYDLNENVPHDRHANRWNRAIRDDGLKSEEWNMINFHGDLDGLRDLIEAMRLIASDNEAGYECKRA